MPADISLNDIKKFWPTLGPDIKNVPKYIKKYTNENIVIKCGGKVLGDPVLYNYFITDIAILNKLGLKVIVVHGGGVRIQEGLDKLNIKSRFVNGLRITDKLTMEVVENSMNQYNKEIIKALENKFCEAKGFGASKENIFIVTQESSELGFVGKPKSVISSKVQEVLKQSKVAVISPVGIDTNKQKYNINADTAACSLAKELKARRLLLMTDVEGVYDGKKKLMNEIKQAEARNLIDNKIILGGMIPKIKNCIDAVLNGVKGIVIIDGRKTHSILYEIFSDEGAGTLIRK